MSTIKIKSNQSEQTEQYFLSNKKKSKAFEKPFQCQYDNNTHNNTLDMILCHTLTHNRTFYT